MSSRPRIQAIHAVSNTSTIVRLHEVTRQIQSSRCLTLSYVVGIAADNLVPAYLWQDEDREISKEGDSYTESRQQLG